MDSLGLRSPLHHTGVGSGQHHQPKGNAVIRKTYKTVGGYVAQEPAYAKPSANEREHQPHPKQSGVPGG
jgi:hypothetical protein